MNNTCGTECILSTSNQTRESQMPEDHALSFSLFKAVLDTSVPRYTFKIATSTSRHFSDFPSCIITALKMSNSRSELQHEIASIASQVESLEIEIPSKPQPITINNPCGPRWLSLSPYKHATNFFNNWGQVTEDFIVTPPASPAKFEDDPKDEDVMNDSQISNLELSESQTSREFDIYENAEDRVLGALRCYHFNLEMGTLATGEFVDQKVADAMEKLAGLSQAGGECSSPERDDVSFGSQRGEPSDEERLVGMLDLYIQQVRSRGVKPAQDVVALAGKVLEWAAEWGTVDGGELF